MRKGREVVGEQSALGFAGLLRRRRTSAGLTQERLAEAASLSPRSISDLERGINLTARKETARLLADALTLAAPVRELFEAAAGGRASAEDVLAAIRGVQPGSFAAAATRTLPRDIASFTGRRAELGLLTRHAELAATSGGGVVGIHAIDGMAGIGKTTFVVHAAHQLAGRFPDGQIFLPLHAHTPGKRPVDPGDALASLLLTTGISSQHIPPGLEARTGRWRDYLAGKKILLVLDDAAGHEQVRPLLPGTAGSLVLITSRLRLTALEDTPTISLDTLPPAEAGELLARLAGRPDLGSGTGAAGQITRLCGYLPLAIGMLARQLSHHPAWTAASLAADLAMARGRLAVMHAENLSVAGAFDLSYNDLTAGQQRLFHRLGLHPGPDIDACAAAALGGADLATTIRHLDDLYDQHLLTEPALGRYRLHDLLREHARTLAAAEEPATRDAATGRLLDYYLDTAAAANRFVARGTWADLPPITYPPQAAPELRTRDEALAWLTSELANMHACTEYAASHAQPVHAVWIPAQLSQFLRTQGHWDRGYTLHQIAATISRITGDVPGQAAALTDLGNAQYDIGQFLAATASLTEALMLYRELSDQVRQADVLTYLGVVQISINDYPAAIESFTGARALSRDVSYKYGQASALSFFAIVLLLMADFPSATASGAEALALYRDLGDRAGQAKALSIVGRVQRYSGCYQPATNRWPRL